LVCSGHWKVIRVEEELQDRSRRKKAPQEDKKSVTDAKDFYDSSKRIVR
jgi:hypothetical protein